MKRVNLSFFPDSSFPISIIRKDLLYSSSLHLCNGLSPEIIYFQVYIDLI